MSIINKNPPATQKEIADFLKKINFNLPIGFLNFYQESNGASISGENKYVDLWPITKLVDLNLDYNTEEFAPEFFIFGSDGGDIAYVIEKSTGDIYEMPFIGMEKEEAILISKELKTFIEIV